MPGPGLIALVALLGAGCSRHEPAPALTTIRLVRDTYVSSISEPLAVEYGRSLPHLDVRLTDASGSTGTVEAIQRGDADLGFVFADVAYMGNLKLRASSNASLREVSGMATLQVTPVHVLVRHGVKALDVRDLRGLRVRTGPPASGQAVHAELVFRAYGLGPESVERKMLTAGLIAEVLADGSVDAAFATAYYPAPEVFVATTQGAHLIPIDGAVAEQLIHQYPFMRLVSIPANTYPDQPLPVRTVGVDRVLICRSDLDDRLVHDLTQQFFDALPRLSSSLHTSLSLMDLEQAPATPVPLHKGAAQYYRERELMR